jgi:hypothetical protein
MTWSLLDAGIQGQKIADIITSSTGPKTAIAIPVAGYTENSQGNTTGAAGAKAVLFGTHDGGVSPRTRLHRSQDTPSAPRSAVVWQQLGRSPKSTG